MQLPIAVIVPGILGSTLAHESGEEIWSANFFLNYERLSSNPTVLRWNNKRAARAVLIESAEFSLGLARWLRRDLWEPTLRWVRLRFGPDPVLYGYDWRASLVETAEELSMTLGKRAGAVLANPRPAEASAFVFITHSMGGLLPRIAMGTGLLHPSWIDRLIQIGTPLLGSPAAFRSVYGRADLPHLSQLLSFRRWKNSGDYFRILQECFRSFPSLYQLFPPRGIEYIYYGPWRSQRRNPLDEAVIGDDRRRDALAAHAALQSADQTLQRMKKRVDLVFTDSLRSSRTELEYVVFALSEPERRYVVQRPYAESERGDGTVPAYSATASSGDVYHHPVTNAEHAYLCNNRRVAELLSGII